MSAIVCQRVVRRILCSVFAFSVLLVGQAPPPSTSDAFFLDLGIVIEPIKGTEEVNRLVKAPPEKVSFLLDKVPSGALFMASTKEMHQTLERINQRLATLETAFNDGMSGLEKENRELREMVSDLLAREPIIQIQTVSAVSVVEEKPAAEPAPVPGTERSESVLPEAAEAIIQVVPVAPEMEKIPFNRMLYMNAVFAYQREDYVSALAHFSRLALTEADQVTAGNILYWMADCHYQLKDYETSLDILKRVSSLFNSDKQDDAMILTGLVYRLKGEETRALQAFGEIIDAFPDSEYFNLAQMELRRSER